MSKIRYVNTKFWDDDYIGDLSPLEKLVFIYLLTNANTNILGIFEITDKRISFDTGISRPELKVILERFSNDRKIRRIGDHVAMLNFVKHQSYKGKLLTAAQNVFRALPSEVIEDQEVKKIGEYLNSLSKEYGYPIDTPSIPQSYPTDTANHNSNSNSNSNSNNTLSLVGCSSDAPARARTHARGKPTPPPPPDFEPYPKTEDDPELIQFFADNGSDEAAARRFFLIFNSKGWIQSNQQPILSWRSRAKLFIDEQTHNPGKYNSAKGFSQVQPERLVVPGFDP